MSIKLENYTFVKNLLQSKPDSEFTHGMCVRFTIGILNALEYLSQHDIVCREISTSSCILTSDPSGGMFRYNIKISLMKNFRQLEYQPDRNE